MPVALQISLIISIVLVVVMVILYFLGKRMQKKQEEQKAQIEAAKQTVTMLIIDKKKMRLKNSGLPAVVLEQTPKYLRLAKFPVVKVKVGPQILSMICDDAIFDTIPLKKEVKATVSGIYITSVKGIRGKLDTPPVKKKGKFKAWVEKLQEKAGAKPLK